MWGLGRGWFGNMIVLGFLGGWALHGWCLWDFGRVIH